jgi:hypothetical protein
MAIVTRYFSTTGAGAADGTTWADRAALFSAGNWSTVITGFDFGGADSMLALIEGGLTYTCSQTLQAATFSVAQPTAANNLVLHGCNSSGTILEPPDPDWTSDQPAFSDATLPIIPITTNIHAVNQAYIFPRLIKFTGSGNTTNPVAGGNISHHDWCIIVNSTSNTNAKAVETNSTLTNCVVEMTGTSYLFAVGVQTMHNCRVIGNISASSGNRNGWAPTSASPFAYNCTFYDHPASQIAPSSASTAFSLNLGRCTVDGAGSSGSCVLLPSTASQAQVARIFNSVFVNSGAFGINAQSAARVFAVQNRLRDNTSGNFGGFLNHISTETNYTTDAADADDFVDAASGDYRIKNTAAIWGKGYGVSDQPPAGGSTRGYIIGG